MTGFGHSLQWGRDVTVADVIRLDRKDGHSVALQWGRDVTVADVAIMSIDRVSGWTSFNGAATLPSRMSSCGVRSLRRRSRFNGAATLPSRMCRTSDRRRRGGVMLQWGRDVTVADVRPTVR